MTLRLNVPHKNNPYSACVGKIAYAGLGEAQVAASQLGKRSGKRSHAYKCPYCPSYHVARSDNGRKLKGRR